MWLCKGVQCYWQGCQFFLDNFLSFCGRYLLIWFAYLQILWGCHWTSDCNDLYLIKLHLVQCMFFASGITFMKNDFKKIKNRWDKGTSVSFGSLMSRHEFVMWRGRHLLIHPQKINLTSVVALESWAISSTFFLLLNNGTFLLLFQIMCWVLPFTQLSVYHMQSLFCMEKIFLSGAFMEAPNLSG